MRIAMVVEAASGGAGRHVIDLTSELLSMGHTVHVLYSSGRADQLFLKGLAALAPDQGFRSREYQWTRGLSPGDFGAVLSVASYLRREGPFDVVHAHSTKAGLLARLAGAACRVPVLYTPHGVMSWDPTISAVARRLAGWLEWGLSLLTARVIAVSDCERRHLQSLGISRSVVRLAPNGIDAGFYRELLARRSQVRAEFGLLDSEICVGCVARFVVQKNHRMLLAAFARAAESNPGLRLMLVGDGPLETDLRLWALSLGLGSRVVWCGPLDAAQALPAFDIFALSSSTESMPYAVLEAVASGLPVVATDVGGMSELVADGENGFLVPRGDVPAFSKALAALAASAPARERMAAAAGRQVFDRRIMASLIAAQYRDAVRPASRDAFSSESRPARVAASARSRRNV